jgi:toxin ParE1/3/4
MASVTWTPKARNDLQAAYEYIARDSPRLAGGFVLRVEAAVDRLAVFPESGRMVPEFRRRDI